MKQFKKLTALLLTAALVLSLFPAAVFAVEGEEALPAPEAPNYGLINKYHEGTTAVTDAYLRGESLELNGVSVGGPIRDLPSKYDSRDYGYVTSVKNQNPYGSCWAHAAVASIESYMIKHGIPVGTGAAATTALNLSETQHCWFNYTYAYDAEGMLTGDKSTPQDTCLDQGGNGEMSAYTLQRWAGAAPESPAALAYSNASTVNSSGLDSQYAYQYNISHVQNSEWIPGTNIDAVKQAIMDYGAGNISYYETGYAYSYICTIDNSSQDSYSHKWANHAITLIGWDDTVAVSKFQPNKPSRPGAWICKNSWGSGQFDNGYCYISYEDTSVLEGYIYFYDAEPIDNYQHNYQYDGTCNVVCYGKGWNNSLDYYEGFANDTKVANVFTAKGNELLRAVAFCNWDEAMSYTVEIYKNPSIGNPSSGELVSSQDGFLTFSGYYTIPLDTPVRLAAGESFSVVVTQNVPVADDNGRYIHTPYDASFSNSSVISWASFIHANHGNTSYYKEPNGAWTDCPENGDYRIKAFTDDILFNLTAVSNNEAWGTVAVEGAKIIASPAEGYYAASCDVISGEASCTININTILVSASEDCTVRVNFAPKPSYTVSFLASGTWVGSQTAQIYDEITLPETVSIDPEGWSFTGWTTQQLEQTTEVPEFYAPGASYMVTADAILYALFTQVEEGTGGKEYVLVDSVPADWTGNYVISYGTDSGLYLMKGVSVSSNGADIENSANAVALSASGMQLNGTKLTNAADSYVFTLAASGNYYTICSVSTNVYVGETTGNYLGGYNSYSAGYCDWSIGTHTNASSATCVNGGSYPYLSFNPSSGYFWTQGVNGVSNGYVYNIRWWKETNGDTVYYWTDPVAGEHEHLLNWLEPKDPTCTEDGNIACYRCSICGKYFSDEAGENELDPASVLLPALGHVPGEPVIENETAPTCGADGGYDTVVRCTVCQAVLSSQHTALPATGDHAFSAWASNNDGTHSRACAVCGRSETEDCTLEEQVIPPTPTEEGFTTHSCSVCGYSYTDSIVPALGYDYTVHFSVPEGVDCPADMVSNTNSGIELPGLAAPEGYIFLGWVTEQLVNAPEQPAEILRGHYTAAADVTLFALFVFYEGGEHSFELLRAAPEDWTGRYVVSYGAEAAYVMKGLAAGLSYEDRKNGGAVPLADTGMARSGDKLTKVSDEYIFAAEPHGEALAFRSVSESSYLAAKRVQSWALKSAADYEEDCAWTPAAAASGVVTLTNSVADANRSVLSFYKSSNNAIYYFRVYSSANQIRLWKEHITGTPYYTTVLTPAEHEHTPGEPVIENETAPTCTQPGGYDTVICCSVCGEELSREHTELPALGHTPGEPVKENEIAPNCTEPGGYDTVSYCAVCGEELEQVHTELEALGHAWDEGVVILEPTETEDGALRYTCTRCGASYEEEIPALGHNCQISHFADVMELYPFETPEHKAIEWAYTAEPQITAGISETAFGVGQAVRRGDAMFYLWVAAGKPNPTLTESPFTDVSDPKAYYYKAVLWAYENGITSGVSKTEFGRKQTVSRRDMLVFLHTQQGKPAPTLSESPYTDVTDPKAYYYKAALWAWENGVEKGTDGRLSGKAKCTRETVVLWLYRVLQGKALAE